MKQINEQSLFKWSSRQLFQTSMEPSMNYIRFFFEVSDPFLRLSKKSQDFSSPSPFIGGYKKMLAHPSPFKVYVIYKWPPFS